MKSIHTKLQTIFGLAAVMIIVPLTSFAQERIAFQTNRDGNHEIYSMKTDGTNQLRLTVNAAFDGEPSFSKDGKIVFSSFRDGNAEIYVMNGDGTQQTRLTNNLGSDAHPRFSADGTKIVFNSDRQGGAYEVWVMNADGTNQARITDAPFGAFNPAFSPDGGKIAYYMYDGAGDTEVFVVNSDGTNPINVTDHSLNDRHPSFSPDGTKIVFERYHDLNWEVFMMNADGTGQVNVSNRPGTSDTDSTFSPDGSHIAFTSNGQIWAMTSGGTGEIALTTADSEMLPSWSPANSAPVLEDVSVTAQVDEGDVATVTGVISDENAGDNFSIVINWGDGTPVTYDYPAGTTTFEETHTYVDDDPAGTASDDYPVLVALNDHRFGFDSVTKTVTVNNVDPEVSNLVLTPATITIGSALRLKGSYTDAGYHGSVQDEALTVTISWGDGQTNISPTVAPGLIDIFHTYAAIGSYTITVKVTDNDQGETIQTIPVVVSPPAPPVAPANLRIDYIAANRVQIAWTDGSNNEDGFAIERCSNRGCSNFIQVGQTGPNTSVYLDNNLFANTQYYYRVRAFNLGGSSGYTNTVSAKTLRK